MWGSRRFATHDDSRNNWWVASLTFGEGWHNNHHAYLSSARHGLAWYEFDPSWIQIKMLKILRVAQWMREAKISVERAESNRAKQARFLTGGSVDQQQSCRAFHRA